MAKRGSKTLLAFGDVHVPHQHLGYLGLRSETLYTVPILGRRCILPDSTEVRA